MRGWSDAAVANQSGRNGGRRVGELPAPEGLTEVPETDSAGPGDPGELPEAEAEGSGELGGAELGEAGGVTGELPEGRPRRPARRR